MSSARAKVTAAVIEKKARTDSTYEKGHEVKSEQMGIFLLQAGKEVLYH
jgi:hypothetical protein